MTTVPRKTSEVTTTGTVTVVPAAFSAFALTAMGDALAGALVAGAFTLLNTALIIGGHYLERREEQRREDERERRKVRGRRRRRRDRDEDDE